jgi:cobaltochelatase CobS
MNNLIDSAVRRMNRFQVRMILDFMGLPFKDQEKSVRKCEAMLKAIGSNDEENFWYYHSIVCEHKVPTKEVSVADEERIRAQKALTDHATYLEEQVMANAHESAQRIVGRLTDDVTKKVDQQIEEAKKQFVTHQVKVGNKKPKKIKGTPPKQFNRLLQLAQSRKNILMVGPSGCGKTHVAAMIAEALDLEFAAQSCSVGVSESNFVGWLLPTGTNGQFNHVVSSFLKLYENGGCFLIDEMDNADPNLLVFLNMALANKGFYLPQRFDNPEVKRHPDFVCVAAANTFGMGADALYSSRNALDAATLDRFRIGTVEMDYDIEVEKSLITAPYLLKFGIFVRTVIQKHNLAKLMSTRAMIDAQDMMLDHDWTLKEVAKSYFSSWSPEEMAMIKYELREFFENVDMAIERDNSEAA